jgi:type I restriction enzyme M protein
LDRAKANGPRADLTLFIDARQIYQQVDRARREFTDAQIESLANVVRLWRKQPTENVHGSDAWLRERFPDLTYRDVEGLCRVATRAEIEAQGWSLNPGRYVGQAQDANDDFDFKTRLGELREELQALNLRAAELQELVTRDIDQVLNG